MDTQSRSSKLKPELIFEWKRKIKQERHKKQHLGASKAIYGVYGASNTLEHILLESQALNSFFFLIE